MFQSLMIDKIKVVLSNVFYKSVIRKKKKSSEILFKISLGISESLGYNATTVTVLGVGRFIFIGKGLKSKS